LPIPLRTLAGDLTERTATSVGEQRAADRLVSELRRSTHQVWQEPFASFRSPRPAWALLLGLAMLGGLLYWTLPGVGFALALLAAVGFACQAAGWLELGWLFPTGESQNVVGVLPAQGEIRARLVVLAHYDTGVRVWTGRSFVLVGSALMLLPPLGLLGLVSGSPLWDSLLALCLVAIGGGIALVLRGASQDRNDAGVAVALACGSGPSLQHTELWTVFTGCRVPGLVGMKAFLHRHGRLLGDAQFIVLEEEDGTLLTLQQRQAEAAVLMRQGHEQVMLLHVDPNGLEAAREQVRAMAEEIDQATRNLAV